jgi:serine/threonine protein phosphatase 1
MATIAIGDIHGCLYPLADLLDQLAAEVAPHDSVVFLGDYIDRGPDSKRCLEAILQFRRDAKADVVCLRGNHEDWFLRTLHDPRRHSWLLGMEAFDTIRSYSPEAAAVLRAAAVAAGPKLVFGEESLPYGLFFESMPAAHLEFLANGLLPFHRTPDCVCVHGGVDPARAGIEDQSCNALIWGGDGFPEQYRGAEEIVYGHRDNAQLDDSGWPMPRIIGRTIGIDTISHGVLTALRLPDGRVFQSEMYAL